MKLAKWLTVEFPANRWKSGGKCPDTMIYDICNAVISL